jgi:hypothetical protein
MPEEKMDSSRNISTNSKSRLLTTLTLMAVLVLGIGLTTVPVVKASPTTWHVYPGDSIQAVLDSASPRDTIIVHE